MSPTPGLSARTRRSGSQLCAMGLSYGFSESQRRTDQAGLGEGHLWQPEVMAVQVVMGSRGRLGQSSPSRPMPLPRYASIGMLSREISPQGWPDLLHRKESRSYLNSSC